MNHLEESLHTHAEICDAMHQVILEENRFLKGNSRPPEEDLLMRKRMALAALSGSLAVMKSLHEQGKAAIPALRALIEKVQQIIMRALLVDRENEQLLLKCSMRPAVAAPAAFRPTLTHLQRAYGAAGR